MKRTNFVGMIVLIVALAFAGTAFAIEPLPAQVADNSKIAAELDWTPAQIAEFAKQPWTKEQLERMGADAYVISKDKYQPRHVGNDLTPKQLYENGRNVWLPIVWQYGLGMSMKEFKKIWIDEGKWQDPTHIFLDLRMESEFNQGHVPGAIWVDTGLDYWLLPAVAKKQDATYYLQCKSGTPEDGGVRGALVRRHMIDMGYTGKIYNLTDGFRGWLELGYPIVNRHGHFTLVPGTFQKPDPYKGADKSGAVTFPYTPR